MNSSKNIQKETEKLQNENRQLLEQIEVLNNKLMESEAFKSHFLSNVTNEIINPFASVIGLSRQIMTLGEKECKKAAELATLIYSEAASLDFQLRNIFVAARLEAGEEIPQPSKINLSELVSDVINKIRHLADAKQIAVQVDTGKNTETFVSDREKLDLILLNLLSNAINFSDNGKEVNVHIYRDNNQLIMEVRDQGIGMTQEEKNRIFDRFHRANPRIQSVSPGSGLGLAVVEGLLFLLDGKIDVQTAPKKGTTIRVTVPEMNPDQIEFNDELFFDDDSEESF